MTQNIEHERKQAKNRAEKNPVPWSLIGGALMAVFAVLGLLISGQANSSQSAAQLIETMSPPLQMLAFATITATITMLSLILTMLGIIKESELDFTASFFALIEHISFIDIILIIMSAILLTVLAIPFTEAEAETTSRWITLMYYALVIWNALIVGLLVAVVLMLFDTIKSVIRIVNVKNQHES